MGKLRAWWVYDFLHTLRRKREDAAWWCAQHTPRWLRYLIVMDAAVQASFANPEQGVPTITWADMTKAMGR